MDQPDTVAVSHLDSVTHLLEVEMACFPVVEPQPITNSTDYRNGYNSGARRAYMNCLLMLSQLRSEVSA